MCRRMLYTPMMYPKGMTEEARQRRKRGVCSARKALLGTPLTPLYFSRQIMLGG